jgi:hypothetical protein
MMIGQNSNDLTQMMGIGSLGEVRQGPDGNLYQWEQGVDGLGNPIGFWRSLRRFIKRRVRPFVKRVLPLAQKFAPMIPWVGPAAAAGIRAATPILQRAGVAGYDGLGALYQAPDGSVYQVAGYEGDEALEGLEADDELSGYADDSAQMLGEVRQGPDGNLYQWVQGVDGLGNPIGFWRSLRRFVKRRGRQFVRRVLPLAQKFAPMIPGVGPAVAAGIRATTPILQQAGVAGYDGLGALYQAPDGSVYQVAGYEGDEALEGLEADDELSGFADDEELRGYDGDEALEGLEAEELLGEEELRGYADGDEMSGYGDMDAFGEEIEGYIPDSRMSGLDAYVPDQPSGTRAFTAQTPETWKAIW